MPKRRTSLPENLERLHRLEEANRVQALGHLQGKAQLHLHVVVIERAMDLADLLRQVETDDEDLKVGQVLGMRIFNAFGASLKLLLSGYSQNAALTLRDVLETIFLLDFFRSDRTRIARWRYAGAKALRDEFSPVKVREALDARDGSQGKRRYELYKLFSELAGHPTMKSSWLMRPDKNGDAVIGPFIAAPALENLLWEMASMAVQAGEVLDSFYPSDSKHGFEARVAFGTAKLGWIRAFFWAKGQKALADE